MKAIQLWEHALMGSRWLLRHQNKDGSWIGLNQPNVDGYHKVLWSFMSTGQLAAAHRTADYIIQNFMTADGDFLPRENLGIKEMYYLYPNAYFIIGAMKASRNEITIPSLRFLLSQQNPDHGGFYSRYSTPDREDISDTISTSMAALACLEAGHLNAARKAANFLADIIDLQPSPKDRFFTAVGSDKKLVTDVKDNTEAPFRIIHVNVENEYWHALGIPFAFLVRLAEDTGETRYFDLARWYFDFQQRCANPWDCSYSGKAGWGCAVLYRRTGNPIYRDISLYIADNIVSEQRPDGNWIAYRKNRDRIKRKEIINTDINLNAEYTLWLSLISSSILARDHGQIPYAYVKKWKCQYSKCRYFVKRLIRLVFKPRRLAKKLVRLISRN